MICYSTQHISRRLQRPWTDDIVWSLNVHRVARRSGRCRCNRSIDTLADRPHALLSPPVVVWQVAASARSRELLQPVVVEWWSRASWDCRAPAWRFERALSPSISLWALSFSRLSSLCRAAQAQCQNLPIALSSLPVSSVSKDEAGLNHEANAILA